jgi:ABC-type Zn2+ transport system substrate-binding protein/surface adhesin
MNVVIESDGFEVELDGALAGFISFEHEPSTDAQRAEVKEMAAKLGQADNLFKAPAAAGCKAQEISLESEALPAELLAPYAADPDQGHSHGHGDHGHSHGPGEAGHSHGPGEGDHDHDHDDEGEAGHSHADLEASFEFKCSKPGALASIEVGLFESFPGLEELRVQVLSPKGQSAAELTKASPVLKW